MPGNRQHRHPECREPALSRTAGFGRCEIVREIDFVKTAIN
jgi:hypothetical protein